MDAVVLDLFGTLVDAPTSLDRTYAAQRLARAAGCRPIQVERYLIDTWQARHAGTLPTVPKLAGHLLAAVDSAVGTVEAVADKLCALGHARLVPDASVVRTLTSLHQRELRLGVLSDASAEVAAVWPESPLAALVHAA
jgi:putative hydrolase of the HAD superfamily